MGSSSVWKKIYIKEHSSCLRKEILETFETRKLANGGEVKLLKQVEQDPLCINKIFLIILLILQELNKLRNGFEKRKLFGERNGMFW